MDHPENSNSTHFFKKVRETLTAIFSNSHHIFFFGTHNPKFRNQAMSEIYVYGQKDSQGFAIPASMETFDPLHLTLGNPYRMSIGGSMIPVLYKGQQLVMTTPPLRMPFGPSVYPNKDRDPSVLIGLSYRSALTNKTSCDSFMVLKSMDEKIAATLVSERKRLLPQMKAFTHSDEKVSESYRRITAPKTTASSDVPFPPMLSTKIKLCDPSRTVAFEETQQIPGEVPFDLHEGTVESFFEKGNWVRTLSMCNGLFSREGMVSSSWKMVQGRKANPPTLTKGLYKDEDVFGVSLQSDGGSEDFGTSAII